MCWAAARWAGLQGKPPSAQPYRRALEPALAHRTANERTSRASCSEAGPERFATRACERVNAGDGDLRVPELGKDPARGDRAGYQVEILDHKQGGEDQGKGDNNKSCACASSHQRSRGSAVWVASGVHLSSHAGGAARLRPSLLLQPARDGEAGWEDFAKTPSAA